MKVLNLYVGIGGNRKLGRIMDINDLAQSAISAINNTPHGFSPGITLNMPGEWGKRDTRRLAGVKSPLGTIVQSFAGSITVQFDAIDILAYCVANGVQINETTNQLELKRAAAQTERNG